MDGYELILDGDADSSITADTDDQFDFKLGGSDVFVMTTTSFNMNSTNYAQFDGVVLAQQVFG